jgi:tRNA_anti-like
LPSLVCDGDDHLGLVAVVLPVMFAFARPALAQQGDRGRSDAGSAVQATADQLVRDFRKNAKAANQKYKGATLEVSGTVLHVGKNVGMGYVELRAGNDYSGLMCYTKEKQPWGQFAPGQEVKVTGKWPAFAAIASLEDCTVEAVGKSPARTFSAEELAKECQADLRRAGDKLRDATLTVTGVVTETKLEPASGFTQVTLKGSDKAKVVVRLLPSEKDFAAGLKAGDSLTVVGRFAYAVAGEVELDSCLPLTK